MEERTDLVSVIVPVYNIEAYIRDCLDSIVNQSYSNLEVIVVDDGSTDHSGSICDQYASEYACIHVIHQSNRGLSAARNAAMDYMHGEWVTFVDGDDFIHPEMIDALYSTAVRENVKFVRCEHVSTSLNLTDINFEDAKYTAGTDIEMVSPDQELRAILNKQKWTTVWGSIYHRSVLENLRFEEGYNSEDNVFMVEVLHNIHLLCRIERKYYYYRLSQDSITRKAFSMKTLDSPEMMYRRNLLIQEYCPQLDALANENFWSMTIYLYNEILSQNQYKVADALLKRINDTYKPALLSWRDAFAGDLPIRGRMLMGACKVSFPMAAKMWKRIVDYINRPR